MLRRSASAAATTVTATATATATVAMLVLLAGPALAAKSVSYPELLAQVRSGPLIHAVLNPRGKDVEIKFDDLSEWKSPMPAGAQPELERILRARHIKIIFASYHRHAAAHKQTTVHHHLRYIVGGVLIALLLAGAGAWIYRAKAHPRAATARAPAEQRP